MLNNRLLNDNAVEDKNDWESKKPEKLLIHNVVWNVLLIWFELLACY